MTKGLVFDIDRFATHDGPGIRGVIFLKGCPLSCKWCHSPESQKNEPEVIFQANRCGGCKKCLQKPELCPTQALRLCGTLYSAREIFQIIERDKPFYENSGGGITVTGGEPLMQSSFTHELLTLCKQNGIHTALETCGYCSKNALLTVAEVCDLIYYDIKFPVSDEGNALHKKYTGVKGKLIWENLAALSYLSANKITIRVPCIPEINDSPEQIAEIARHVRLLGITSIELMPYNEYASAKYEWLNREYELTNISPRKQSYYDNLNKLVNNALKEI